LFLEGRLYLTTPFNRVIALDPASGNQLWAYDPQIDKKQAYGDGLINRGLAAWRDTRARLGGSITGARAAGPISAITSGPTISRAIEGAMSAI
jgi:hypothetical protein